jgi:hypothetical protein
MQSTQACILRMFFWGLLAAVAMPAFAQQPRTPNLQTSAPWQDWSFLLGEWKGEGSGQPGQGAGGFSLRPDLQRHILVRKNFAEYPATSNRPASRHDDLMVVYQESVEGPIRAIYFDSEGHVIHYGVRINPLARTAIFLSEPAAGAPRYRLSYIGKDKEPDEISIKFEISSPDKPEQFQTYIEATAKRTAQ